MAQQLDNAENTRSSSNTSQTDLHTLTKRQEFEAVIRQNYGDVYVGSQQNGAEGYISNLRYYNHAIGSYTIQDIMYYGPNLKAEGNEMTNTNPPYLSTKWYMNID